MRITNAPDSSALMATARSFGNYDLAAAIADIVDNSITAKASNVDITFTPTDDDVIVRLRDDGYGMTRDELIAAMRPASKHPDEKRSATDLGRFGWGLKSASLSQARIMTVVTWVNNEFNSASWDIDDIANWQMEVTEGDDSKSLLESIPNTKSGTEVVWEKTDRIVKKISGAGHQSALSNLITQARKSLALTFHRHISKKVNKKLSIKINGLELDEIDPFLRDHPATQTLGKEQIAMSSGDKISLEPFVLPHYSKLTEEEQDFLGGSEGMVRNQGFYVYRNQRLIIHGTWFQLVPHREITQLTRVLVDFPNSADPDWRITLDKSGAQLPSELKIRLIQIISKFNLKSQRAHRRKGAIIGSKKSVPVWLRTIKNRQIKYIVNREHPSLISLIKKSEKAGLRDDLSSTLKILESYFPTDNFVQDAQSTSNALNQTPTSTEDFKEILLQVWIDYRNTETEINFSKEDFLQKIQNIEPFASHWRYTKSLVEENLYLFPGA